MNPKTDKLVFNVVALLVNALAAILTWHTSPRWSGACIGTCVWCVSVIVTTIWPGREKLSPESLNYQYGWADGWNACRSAKSEDRVFKRADVIGRGSTKPVAGPVPVKR